MSPNLKGFIVGSVIYLGGVGALMAFGSYSMMHFQHHGGMHMGGMEHDEINMPMLNGIDTTETEVADLKAMFQNHPDIFRTVEIIPNGIKTTTGSTNPELRDNIINHVSSMIGRVNAGQNPQIPIQSPTLTPIFERGATITTDLEVTDTAIIVTQTSTDPEIVAALQKHAGEVSDLAKRGMQAVHEQMMGKNH